jgi:hypothetical protein
MQTIGLPSMLVVGIVLAQLLEGLASLSVLERPMSAPPVAVMAFL